MTRLKYKTFPLFLKTNVLIALASVTYSNKFLDMALYQNVLSLLLNKANF